MQALLIAPPAPGETVYGIIARLRAAQHGATRSCGVPSGSAASLLPGRLGELLEHFPSNLRVPVELFAYRHTALPFFLPFVDAPRAHHWLETLVKESRPHLAFGTAPRGSVDAPRLRLCPLCAKEDRVRFGFPYWHREHQFPFVLVCHRHRQPLRELRLRPHALLCSPAFHTVPVPESARTLRPPPDPAGLLDKLAADVAELLDHPVAPVGWPKIQALLHEQLAKRRYVRADDSVKITRLTHVFQAWAGRALLNRLGCALGGKTHENWIARLVRRRATMPAPLHFLLLGHHFRMSAATLMQKAALFEPRPKPAPVGDHRFRIRCPERLAKLRPIYRQEWLDLRGTSEGRNKRNVYAWLWRNDREWVHQHRAPRFFHTGPRKPWRTIDETLARSIRSVASGLLHRRRPMRASKHRIASQVGFTHYLLSYDPRLPQAVRELHIHAESTEAFACRKLHLVVAKHPTLRLSQPWRLLAAAGIGKGPASRLAVRRLVSVMLRRNDRR